MEEARALYESLVMRSLAFARHQVPLTDLEAKRFEADRRTFRAWSSQNLPSPIHVDIRKAVEEMRSMPDLAATLEASWPEKFEHVKDSWTPRRFEPICEWALPYTGYLCSILDFRIEGAYILLASFLSAVLQLVFKLPYTQTVAAALLVLWFLGCISRHHVSLPKESRKGLFAVSLAASLFAMVVAVQRSETPVRVPVPSAGVAIAIQGQGSEPILGEVDGNKEVIVFSLENLPKFATVTKGYILCNEERTPVDDSTSVTPIYLVPSTPVTAEHEGETLVYTARSKSGKWETGTYDVQFDGPDGIIKRRRFRVYRKIIAPMIRESAASRSESVTGYWDQGNVRAGNPLIAESVNSPASFGFESSFSKIRRGSVDIGFAISGMNETNSDKLELLTPFHVKLIFTKVDSKLVVRAKRGSKWLTVAGGVEWQYQEAYVSGKRTSLCISYDGSSLYISKSATPRVSLAGRIPLAGAGALTPSNIEFVCSGLTSEVFQLSESTYLGPEAAGR